MSCYEYPLPGNYGGETLREYCGLSRFRVNYAFKECFDEGRITTQRLYIAIGRRAKAKAELEAKAKAVRHE